ncbi:hypothetical protein WCE04_28025, partial [Pseudomonas shirazica]
MKSKNLTQDSRLDLAFLTATTWRRNMQIHVLFKKAILAAAVAGVLSTSIVLVPDSISNGSSAYAKDGGGGGGHG